MGNCCGSEPREKDNIADYSPKELHRSDKPRPSKDEDDKASQAQTVSTEAKPEKEVNCLGNSGSKKKHLLFRSRRLRPCPTYTAVN